MIDPAFLYGTPVAPETGRILSAGLLEAVVAGGAVTRVAWDGVEVMRGLDYPIRDPDWGTEPTRTTDERVEESGDSFRYVRRFESARGFTGEVEVTGAASGPLTATLALTAGRDVRVNRAGFVLLHPVACAGLPLTIVHGDGSEERTAFPQRISPSQPAFDIAGLRMRLDGVDVDIRLDGEVFEMEDQRNWTDASFKTYCRPLSKPWPFTIAAGETVRQRVELTLTGTAEAEGGRDTALGWTRSDNLMPGVALAVEAGWQGGRDALQLPQGVASRVRLDMAGGGADLDLLDEVPDPFDLELVVADEAGSIDAALADCARGLSERGRRPRAVFALPAAYMKSYQPDADWPKGAAPEAAASLVRRHFPDAQIVGGMLTNFTELNRYPSAATAGDVLTHSTTAIVHAADDAAVMQTLEALPHVYDSARALAPGLPYRPSLASIAMRTNPYGADVAANPDGARLAMARVDPRQGGLFAAAFMVGVMAATAGRGVEEIALAAPSGPFGLSDGGRPYPAAAVFRWFAEAAGLPRLDVTTPRGIAAVGHAAGALALVVANLSAEPRTLDLPRTGEVRMLARPEDLSGGEVVAEARITGRLELGPYAVAFVHLRETA